MRVHVSGVESVQSAVESLLIQAWLAVLSSGVTVVGQQISNIFDNEQKSKAGMGCTELCAAL